MSNSNIIPLEEGWNNEIKAKVSKELRWVTAKELPRTRLSTVRV